MKVKSSWTTRTIPQNGTQNTFRSGPNFFCKYRRDQFILYKQHLDIAIHSYLQANQIKEDLAMLKRLGLVEPRGRGRGAYWFFVNQIGSELE
jgi:hypothetical protein